jgi:hypothetical protein
MSNIISEAISMIKEADDSLAIRILDSVPSDQLYLIFEDKSEKIQKFRHIYSDILSIKRFKYIDDIVTDVNVFTLNPSDDFYSFIRSINQNKRINKDLYLDNVLTLFDKYVEDNNIIDSYDEKIYNLFKKQINILNYTYLNKFRRALLVTSELF